MYLETLKLRNFRKYGATDEEPGLHIPFTPGINVLVGENDSGKSCIVDAIHFLLYDDSHGWVRISEEDFHGDARNLSIECVFKGLSDEEAKNFLEWVSWNDKDGYFLCLKLRPDRRPSGVFYETRAGSDDEGAPLTKEARSYLCATYLKPLRDARKELSPGRRSRLAQILGSHPEIATEGDHPLVDAVKDANREIRKYFTEDDRQGNSLYKRLEKNLAQLRAEESAITPSIDLSSPNLRMVLEKLALGFSEENFNPGLGSENLLFIAAELLLLKQETEWLKLALIEEIEAHLDPQAQLRVMQFFEREASGVQLIVSTHSPILASAVDLKGLTIFRSNQAFPMGEAHTKLNADDYGFLRRFLDATKANLFFAAGVLIVEGPAENILLPVMAKIVTGQTLAKYGVSIVNVGSTALLRYARIFHRADGVSMGLPVACITDRDIPPQIARDEGLVKKERKVEAEFLPGEIETKLTDRRAKLESADVHLHISPQWTLEFDMAKGSLGHLLHAAIKIAKKTKDKEEALSADKRAEILKEAIQEFDGWQSLPAEERACKIYEPLAKKNASKAAAAEYLADLLEEEYQRAPKAIYDLVVKDPNLKYLVNAIRHVTKES